MEQENKLPKDFFKQFKSKEDFQSFFSELYKEGVEQMLQAELDEHLGYEKHWKFRTKCTTISAQSVPPKKSV